jgi:hypothetical protein
MNFLKRNGNNRQAVIAKFYVLSKREQPKDNGDTEQIIGREGETACILTISSFSTNKDAC